MENYRAVIKFFPFVFLLLFLPLVTFAYEVETHMGITQATVETYVKFQDKEFQQSEISAMVRGSLDEDMDERPVNHFFDPVYNNGLKISLISWPASKVWAQDTEGQANFCIQRVCFNKVGYADKYFSSPIDYSWDRAIYEYVYGNKERGLEGLGHILHLLQDSSVPAHVRNDQHLNKWGGGDFDPYEQYAGRFGKGDVPSLELANIQQRQNLSSYFDVLAGFTNGHFLSKDTLFKKYDYPKLTQLEVRNDGFAYDLILNYRVASVQILRDTFQNSKKVVSLGDPSYDPKGLALADYWSILSKEAIKNGVGVMDLFFREVEKEKQTQILKKKNVSQQEIDAKKVVLKGFSFAKKLYGSSLDENDVADLMENQSASVVNAFNTQVQDPAPPKPNSVVSPIVPKKIVVEEIPTVTEDPGTDVETADVPEPSEPEAQGTIVPISEVSPGGISGSGGGSAPAPVTEETPTVVVTAPTFTSPSQNALFGTTTVTLSGTADANAPISLLITDQGGATSTATTTADSSGIWGSVITTIEGTTTVSATASDSEGNTSVAVLLSYTIDITPPSVAVFSLLECSYAIATDACTTVGSASPQLTVVSPDVSYYAYIVDGSVVSTSATLTSVTLSTGAHSVAISAYDLAGNGATSSPVSIEMIDMPIVINEVGWMGTPASATASWFEIYNRSDHPIDMSQVHLATSDGLNSFTLSGTLTANSYYLIEKDEANTWEPAGFVAPDFVLSSVPTQITLSYIANGGATTTIDATPTSSACGSSWCAGVLGASNLSMERAQPDIVGTLTSNWGSNNTVIKRGQDTVGAVMNATIRYRNSITIDSIGFTNGLYSNPLYIEGGYYQPATGDYRFYSPRLIGLNHFAGVFAGTVGSSTEVSTFFVGSATDSYQHGDPVPAQYQIQDQDLFAVVFITTPGPGSNDEVAQFMDYFRTGVGSTPNSYGILRFKWGP